MQIVLCKLPWFASNMKPYEATSAIEHEWALSWCFAVSQQSSMSMCPVNPGRPGQQAVWDPVQKSASQKHSAMYLRQTTPFWAWQGIWFHGLLCNWTADLCGEWCQAFCCWSGADADNAKMRQTSSCLALLSFLTRALTAFPLRSRACTTLLPTPPVAPDNIIITLPQHCQAEANTKDSWQAGAHLLCSEQTCPKQICSCSTCY